MPYKLLDTWGGADWIKYRTEQIWNDFSFWSTLPVLSPPESIDFDFDCYLTSIPSQMLGAREMWLDMNGFPKKPVVVSHEKTDWMKEKKYDILIDDKPSTIIRGCKEGLQMIYFKPSFHNENIWTELRGELYEDSRWPNKVTDLLQVKQWIKEPLQ